MATASEIRVRILQLGRQVIDYRTEAGQTVGAALAATGIQVGPGMDLRVNGAPATEGTGLRDEDIVTIIPRIKGGWRDVREACHAERSEASRLIG